jgi:CyaY protein
LFCWLFGLTISGEVADGADVFGCEIGAGGLGSTKAPRWPQPVTRVVAKTAAAPTTMIGLFMNLILVVSDMPKSFADEVDVVFKRIEDSLDALDLGIEAFRQGPVLEIEFEDDSKIVVNSQAAMQEIWLAAKAGGFHFKLQEGRWLDTRSGEEFFAMLSRFCSMQSDQAVIIA